MRNGLPERVDGQTELIKENLLMQRDYSKMTEQEALEVLRAEWPEYNAETEMMQKDGDSLIEWLSILESFA